MQTPNDLIPRRAFERVAEALTDTRVVVVTGARQVGKSTLAATVLQQHPNAIARLLDSAATRSAATIDPAGFLEHDGLMLIDEVQRVPELWLAIKYLVDTEPRPGRFLLTGSARLLSLNSIPDALPGRTETIDLWPLSQGELENGPDGFVDAAFLLGPALRAQSLDLKKKDYVDRAVRGGYPEAVRRTTPRRRDRFFEGYIADLMVRDVKQVADINRAADMRRLIALLAAQMSGLVSMRRLAGAIGVSVPTIRSWIRILETIYLIRIVPAWSTNATTRTVATPKVMFTDTGLAYYLSTDISAEPAVGGLIENFVLSELARQLTWSRTSARLYHYRDRDQHEVDAILENNAGQIVGVEVKAAQSLRAEDFAGLRSLRRRVGDQMRAGFLLYCGQESLSFGDGIVALPISALWTTPSPTLGP